MSDLLPALAQPPEQESKKLRISALIVMAGTAMSRVLGFVRNAVVSYYFGGAGKVDVLNAVFTIPNNLRKLVAEGALSSAFIPVLSSSIVDNKSTLRSKALVETLLTFQFVLLVPFLVLSVIFSQQIVQSILGFSEASQKELAGQLFAYMINYVLLVSISAILMAVLNSHNNFGVSALAPLMFSISVVVCLVLFAEKLSVYAQVIGVLFGGILQLAVQIPSVLKLGYRLRLNFSFFKNDDFKAVLRLWGPVLITSAVFSINEMIAIYFASALSPGSTTAMQNALVFWQLPFGIFSASISTILFPRMSRQIANDDTRELKKTVDYGVSMLIYLLVPSTVALMAWGEGLISVALQRGAFTYVHSQMAADVLFAYASGLLFSGLVGFFQRFFYANKSNKAPLIAAILILASDVIASIIFIQLGFGVKGLAYANTIAGFLGLIVLFFYVRRRLNGINIRSLLKSLLLAGLSCVPMVVIALFAKDWLDTIWRQGSTWHGLWILAALLLASMVSVLALYLVTGVKVVDLLRRRGKKNEEQIKN